MRRHRRGIDVDHGDNMVIPLRPQMLPESVKADQLHEVVNNEVMARYLQRLGVNPSKANIAELRKRWGDGDPPLVRTLSYYILSRASFVPGNNTAQAIAATASGEQTRSSHESPSMPIKRLTRALYERPLPLDAHQARHGLGDIQITGRVLR